MPDIAILTRPEGRNATLGSRLARAGWEVYAWPALHLEPWLDPGLPLPRPDAFDLTIFVSGNAARVYLAQLAEAGGGWPQDAIAATVGPASAETLRALGGPRMTILHPGAEAIRHDSEALWALLQHRRELLRRVLIVRGTAGRDWLAETLRAAGASVQVHAAYRRLPAAWQPGVLTQLATWAQAGRCPTWLLTSADSVAAVCANIDRAGLREWWRCGHRFIVTHPRLAAHPGFAPGARITVCRPGEEEIFNAFVAA